MIFIHLKLPRRTIMEQKPKGTYDLLPGESEKYQALELHLRALLELYGYKEIKTPIFEHSSVFHRQNELSDMVTKETYDFKDKGGRDLTLRPEGTAGVIRAYVENKLYKDQISKLFYIGPQFRYERPQKGRFRQFNQMGIEAIGIKSPSLDAEVISLSYHIISSLGLKQVKVKINTLGDDFSKLNYKTALTAYFNEVTDLCEDCLRRKETNPLRILDCKIDGHKEVVKNAPLPKEYLSSDADHYFQSVLAHLDKMDVPYEIEDTLVRGLDYYGHTVFEVEALISGFGAHNILAGGGHYESLVKELGGPDLDGVGVAFGLERLQNALDTEGISLIKDTPIDAYIVSFDYKTHLASVSLLAKLRDLGYKVELDHAQAKFASQFKKAISSKAKHIILIGEAELNHDVYKLKNTKTEKEETLAFDALVRKLG